ncbi:ADP-ribosylation factor GTPase-activating protein 3 [Lates japonicus]|uniref:ADP-ribosylation factor GTPase-activating protein 3 n=1 Tax=Lates japonicus TaxID=270547 RepID=A0AAD3QW23_LATJO|nr:ADP-ribosylation factor GTPase-activating protein 3 [Lates japonicus]
MEAWRLNEQKPERTAAIYISSLVTGPHPGEPEPVPVSDTGEARKKFGDEVRAISSEIKFVPSDQRAVALPTSQLKLGITLSSRKTLTVIASGSYSSLSRGASLLDSSCSSDYPELDHSPSGGGSLSGERKGSFSALSKSAL